MTTTSPVVTLAHPSPSPPVASSSSSHTNITNSNNNSTSVSSSTSASTNTSAMESPSSSPMPSRNPIPLSAAQEGQVRELYHKRVRQKCDDQIREFAMCAKGRTVSMAWACRDQKSAMQTCMARYATLEEQDKAREEWFATRLDRAREREEKAAKKRESDRKRREYYGLDENDRPIARA